LILGIILFVVGLVRYNYYIDHAGSVEKTAQMVILYKSGAVLVSLDILGAIVVLIRSKQTYGIMALILGLFSVLTVIVAPFDSYNILTIPPLAIIFGIIGITKDELKGMALAGLVLGIIGLGRGIFLLYYFWT
jgi:hypothetical protein